MEDTYLIETPENVELEQPLAGIGSRFAAGMLDQLILIGVFVVVVLMLWIVLSVSPLEVVEGIMNVGSWVLALLVMAGFMVYWGYFVYFEMRTNGQSPGKRRMKIRVVKQGGGAITFTDIAIRNLMRVVDGFAVYGVAGICMFVTQRGQRLGDLAAGTLVVSEQTPEYSSRTDKKTTVVLDDEVGTDVLQATGLTLEEYHVLSSYWQRRLQMTLQARERLLPRLLRPILERNGRTFTDRPLEILEEAVGRLIAKADEARRQSGSTPSPPGALR